MNFRYRPSKSSLSQKIQTEQTQEDLPCSSRSYGFGECSHSHRRYVQCNSYFPSCVELVAMFFALNRWAFSQSARIFQSTILKPFVCSTREPLLVAYKPAFWYAYISLSSSWTVLTRCVYSTMDFSSTAKARSTYSLIFTHVACARRTFLIGLLVLRSGKSFKMQA